MDRKRVCAVFFSATDTTKTVVTHMAKTIAEKLGLPLESMDFTLPQHRAEPLCFDESDLVVFGTPVYAGRVPNVLLKYLDTLQGNGALAVPVVLFGNRNYDDALIELRDILHTKGFHPIAAGAFVGEHSFSYTLAKKRPDEVDLLIAYEFSLSVANKVAELQSIPTEPVAVNGTPHPYSGYYQPRDRKGNPVDIRKVKPLTNDNCNDCKICVDVCPMGSISRDDVREYVGICIKCGACIKKCPQEAKYYDDAGYLYHKVELEEGLVRRAEPELFL